MKRGDILLLHYKIDPIGYFIRFMTRGRWNHVGVAINETEIIEYRATRMRIRPVSKFKNKFLYSYKLVRHTTATAKQIDFVINKMRQYNTIRPYFAMLLTFMLLFFGYRGKLPRHTCSGVIAIEFAKKGIFFDSHKSPYLIFPKDLSNSKEVIDVSSEF